MEKSLSELKTLVAEAETKKDKLVLEKLPYARNALAPVMSENTIDYHYGKLAKAYVDRYNKGEGDEKFNEAGAFLHNLFFPQLKEPSSSRPFGSILEFIDQHFGSFDEFKDEFSTVAMKIQGSGWVYLARNGKIKTIANHEIRNDILLLVDWWEHAFNFDYETDKAKYLKNLWRIINWKVINDRLNLEK
jgi:Fe-Mn family superoxide dismutase